MIVVFDTNAYLSFVSRKTPDESLVEINTIKDLQNKKQITSIMSATVAGELISHLYDGGVFRPDGYYTTAIRVMYTHCGDDAFYGMVPLPVVQISRAFFYQDATKDIEIQNIIAQICHSIFKNPTQEEADKHQENIKRIKKHNSETEAAMKEFLKALSKVWKTEKGTEEEKAKKISEMTAIAFIVQTAQRLGFHIPASLSMLDLRRSFDEKITAYMTQYPAPLKMRENFVKKLSNPHFKPDKPERVNLVWDEQILHVASQTYNGLPVLLVTNDNGMRTAAIETAPQQNTPFQGNVATLDEYIHWLNQE